MTERSALHSRPASEQWGSWTGPPRSARLGRTHMLNASVASARTICLCSTRSTFGKSLRNTPAIIMRCGLTFRLGRTRPADVRSSDSGTLSRIRSLAGCIIVTHESDLSEATLVAAAVMGLIGYFLTYIAIFVAVAALTPALFVTLARIHASEEKAPPKLGVGAGGGLSFSLRVSNTGRFSPAMGVMPCCMGLLWNKESVAKFGRRRAPGTTPRLDQVIFIGIAPKKSRLPISTPQ